MIEILQLQLEDRIFNFILSIKLMNFASITLHFFLRFTFVNTKYINYIIIIIFLNGSKISDY